MTLAEKERQYLTPEEYLEGEIVSDVRHEYIEGQVFAMAGSTQDHNRIVMNLARELGNALRGKSCEPFGSDMKVKIPPSFGDVFYYPDLLVSCDPADNEAYYRSRPTVVFEVLLETTRLTDEREKSLAYHHINSLQAYVLVEQHEPVITVLHRDESGWRREILAGPDAFLKLDCIGVQIPFPAIYERTSVLGRTN